MNKPFFTNFLEEQGVKQVTGGIVAGDGGCVITTSLKDQFEVTMKAPSDGDEGAEIELF